MIREELYFRKWKNSFTLQNLTFFKQVRNMNCRGRKLLNLTYSSSLKSIGKESWQELQLHHLLFLKKDALSYNYQKVTEIYEDIRARFYSVKAVTLRVKKKCWKSQNPDVLPSAICWTWHTVKQWGSNLNISVHPLTRSPLPCFCNNCMLPLALLWQETPTSYIVCYIYCKHKEGFTKTVQKES